MICIPTIVALVGVAIVLRHAFGSWSFLMLFCGHSFTDMRSKHGNPLFVADDAVHISRAIEFSDTTEIVTIQRPVVHKKVFVDEAACCDHHEARPGKAAQALFNDLQAHGCIAFWLALVQLIRQECIEQDRLNSKCGIDIPSGGWFKKHFDDICSGERQY